MSTYPNNPNEALGANYPNQMNQGQQNAAMQPPYNNYPPSSYDGVPQPQPQIPTIPTINYGVQPPPNYGIPQQNYGIPPQPNYGMPPQPNYGMPPQPNYGMPPQPNYGMPPQPNYGMPSQPNYGMPPQSNYLPPTAPIQQTVRYRSTLQKSKPQSNSLGAASMILTSGGMKMAWGTGLGPGILGILGWGGRLEHLTLSWFIGVIIGAFLSVFFINKVGKKIIYYFSALLVIIGGILFTACPMNIDALLAARYLDGIGNGLTIVTLLSSGGELVVKELRGMVVSVEKLSFSIGYMIESICGFYMDSLYVKETNQIHGGLTIFYGVLSLVINTFFTIESPVYHLLHNNENDALIAQKKLLNRYENRDQLSCAFLEEHKRLIEDDSSRSKGENIRSSLLPIIKLSILRSIVSLTVSLPINSMFVLVYVVSYQSFYGLFYYGFVRFFGNLTASLLVDSLGRKNLSFISTIVSGTLFFTCGGLYEGLTYSYVYNMDTIYWCTALLIVLQFFVGLGIEPTSSIYLSEAFSLSVKPLCIFIIICFENIVQIITIVIINSNSSSYLYNSPTFELPIDYSTFCYVMGSFMFGLFIMFAAALPETKGLKLLFCREQFLRIINLNRN